MSESRALTIFEAPVRKYPWADDQEVLEALQAMSFHVGNVARYFGVKRRDLAARIAETPDLQLEQVDFIEEAVDDAEAHFIDAARKGNKEAVVGLLNSRGKARGYGKQEAVMEGLEVVIRQISKEPS